MDDLGRFVVKLIKGYLYLCLAAFVAPVLFALPGIFSTDMKLPSGYAEQHHPPLVDIVGYHGRK